MYPYMCIYIYIYYSPFSIAMFDYRRVTCDISGWHPMVSPAAPGLLEVGRTASAGRRGVVGRLVQKNQGFPRGFPKKEQVSPSWRLSENGPT